jgi:TonB family protein
MKYLLSSLFFVVLTASTVKAQDTLAYVQITEVDVAPIAPGCEEVVEPRAHMQCLQAMITNHIKSTYEYPEEAKENNITGQVIVRFLIDREGKVREVKVVRSAHELLDREAERIFSTLPQFQPAQKDGKNVAVQFYFPINFQL